MVATAANGRFFRTLKQRVVRLARGTAFPYRASWPNRIESFRIFMSVVNTSGEPAAYDFYVSDAAEKFKKFANSILPYDVDKTQAIDIEDY